MIDLTTLNDMLADAQCVAANKVVWHNEVTSTSDLVAAMTDFHGAVCLAGMQTAGRGRRGAQWRAPFGSSILMSLGWRLTTGRVAGLSLALGVAIREALLQSGVTGVSLKWPNDVLIGGRKLGGILVELSGNRCVIGVGLNRDMGEHRSPAHHPDQYPGQTRTPWTDMNREGFSPDPLELYCAIITGLCNTLGTFGERGFSAFRSAWERAHYFQGREVDVLESSGTVRGIVAGADSDGGLVLDTPRGRRVFHAGEVSMIPLSTQGAA